MTSSLSVTRIFARMAFSGMQRQQQIRLNLASRIFHRRGNSLDPLLNSQSEWASLLAWLDTSGLALPFYAHLQSTGEVDQVPTVIQRRLAKNLQDNTARMKAMAQEVVDLHRAFSRRNVEYALLKGLSLRPHSVPRMELRSQLDLDFLVRPDSLSAAQAALAEAGFHLHARCCSSYEYKTMADPPRSLAELYSVHPCRTAELHSADLPFRSAALSRRVTMPVDGEPIPVLAPCDLLLGQARHLYKHICSPCFRAAHLLEFAQHVRFRATQETFWPQMFSAAESAPDAAFQLAFCARFAEQCFQTIPGPLSRWAAPGRLPPFVTLWIERYAAQLLTQDFPGSKIYLLLQYEAERHATPHQSRRLRKALLPLHPPPRISPSSPEDSLGVRAGKMCRQALYMLARFRFHLASGTTFLLELGRWKRSVRTRQSNDIALTHP